MPPAPHSQQEAQPGSLPTPASPSEPGGGQELEDYPKLHWTKTLPPALHKEEGEAIGAGESEEMK